MAEIDKTTLAQEVDKQAEQLKKADPDAKVDVDHHKSGNVETSSVKVSTEKKTES